MLGSSNNYFYQDNSVLQDNKVVIRNLLLFKHGYTVNQFRIYMKAYDFFCANPELFDGSTFTKDLFDIYPINGFDGLDLDAMLHDWFYIFYCVKCSFIFVAMADNLFVKEMEKKNKSEKQFLLFTYKNFYSHYKIGLLKIIRPIFVWLSKLKHGEMTDQQQKDFINDYYNLMYG